MSASPSAGDAAPRSPRWYAPSMAKFLAAILVLQGVLYLSDHTNWFWFNRHQGFTVLIAVAVTATLLLLVLAWVVVGRLFGAKTQFSLAVLLLMVPVMGIPCGWLAREIEQARKRRDILASVNISLQARIEKMIREIEASSQPRSPLLQWLRSKLGNEFFEELTELSLDAATDEELERVSQLTELRGLSIVTGSVTDAGLKHLPPLTNLESLTLGDCPVTDKGVQVLKGLPKLKSLSLARTQVTEAGEEELRRAMPNCEIKVFDAFVR
jgi:hypothetical protein